MIEAAELRVLADARFQDARTLHVSGHFEGAIYLCGYCVELALKARICQTLGWSEFPSERKDFQGLQSFQTHDLKRLLHLSGRETHILESYSTAWNIVSTWESEWRYLPVGTTSQAQSALMLAAIAIVREEL